MLRRAALVTFASAVVLAAACGHQVTPSPSENGQNNNLAGNMLIRFRTVQPLNYQMYDYAIIINTCGGGTPYPNVFANTFLDYTFSFNIGVTSFGAATAFPILLQYILTPGTQNQLNPQNVPISPSETTLTLNSNGQGTEFTLIFPRALLQDPLGPTALPCTGSLRSPAPASPTPSLTPAPITPTPTATPTSSATAGPSALPTTLAQSKWSFNFFTIDSKTLRVQDSLGIGGPTDNSYTGAVIDTTTTNSTLITKQPDVTGAPSDPAAALAGGEIDNNE